ncbi:MAG: hypothetical protein A2516_09450 [Alphaproteobacteria bacterium RIFOXYD12_FULL_60_8]|nr:MAG: hypothetical protein A2516_09450 [Alphaproteobacteria bacterium RIFOXYD12_FULL_60_8]
MKLNSTSVFRLSVLIVIVAAIGITLGYGLMQVALKNIRPDGQKEAMVPLPPTPPALGALVTIEDPIRLPAQVFWDGEKNKVQLDNLEFRSKVLLINLWATNCPPCVREMPALDNLQAKLGSKHFEVVAVNQDVMGVRKAKPFMEENNLKNLKLYVDPKAFIAKVFKTQGLPTTYVVDGLGYVRASLLGVAEWDSPEVIAYLEQLIANGHAMPGFYINK